MKETRDFRDHLGDRALTQYEEVMSLGYEIEYLTDGLEKVLIAYEIKTCPKCDGARTSISGCDKKGGCKGAGVVRTGKKFTAHGILASYTLNELVYQIKNE